MIRWLLDTLYPKRCVSCSREGSWLCHVCEKELVPLCSKPDEKTLALCQYDQPLVRPALHGLKYEGVGELAEELVRVAWPCVAEEVKTFCTGAAGLVPIPVHAKTYKERGYSQAQLLASALSARLGIPVVEDVLKKTQAGTQVGLGRADRLARHSFQAVHLPENLEAMILVDDVLTTGATLAACREVLGENVRAVVIARQITEQAP
jgi:ComF family protein